MKRIECADCGRPLAELDVLGTRPLKRPEFVRCACPYCRGHSHPEEMVNRYHLAPAVAFLPDMPDEYRELTVVTAPRYEGDLVTYQILEAKWQQ